MSLGIYIQVPFCQTKCTYCNFHTGIVSRDRFRPYAEAVCREIAELAGGRAGQNVDTAYFGGGTPSLLDPAALTAILDALRRTFRFETAEITLEADPETISREKADQWLAAGFNRVSLGVQSFQDNELKAAGRMHRRADIFSAVEALRASGFANISMDLIAGLPHQTHESWESVLAELLALRPEHVSVYLLEIDQGSRLGRESLAGGSRYSAAAIPSDDEQADFYESACSRLAAAGYQHYEISNWALPGHSSQHNRKYWRREPYLGFGAGAHSFDGERRWANDHDSLRYAELIQKGVSPREQVEVVTREQAFEEELFLGLRLLEGVDLEAIEAAYRIDFEPRLNAIRAALGKLSQIGLIEIEGSRFRLAPGRLAVSNEVLVELLSADAEQTAPEPR